MSNYGWTNADGEPIMDGAAYRFEQALDDQYANERAYYYDLYEDIDPEDCPHADGTYLGSGDEDATEGDFACDGCDEIVGRWMLGEDGCPHRV